MLRAFRCKLGGQEKKSKTRRSKSGEEGRGKLFCTELEGRNREGTLTVGAQINLNDPVGSKGVCGRRSVAQNRASVTGPRTTGRSWGEGVGETDESCQKPSILCRVNKLGEERRGVRAATTMDTQRFGPQGIWGEAEVTLCKKKTDNGEKGRTVVQTPVVLREIGWKER